MELGALNCIVEKMLSEWLKIVYWHYDWLKNRDEYASIELYQAICTIQHDISCRTVTVVSLLRFVQSIIFSLEWC
jgi:hypothetical protein